MRHCRRRSWIFWRVAGPALLVLPFVGLVLGFGTERTVSVEEQLQGVRGQTPAELSRLFWLLLALVSAILAFWILRLWLGLGEFGRLGVVASVALWLVGAVATLLLVSHNALVIVAWTTDGEFPADGLEAMLFFPFGIFGMLQGAEHFLYKLQGSRAAWLEAGWRFRRSALGGVIGAEIRRRRRTGSSPSQQSARASNAEPEAAVAGGRDAGDS